MASNNTQYHLHLHLLVLVWLFSYTLQDDACRILGCGEGRCVAPDDNRLSYHCECNRGWKTIMVAPMRYPSCIVPNCTIKFPCDGRAPPTPPSPRPLFNNTNVCNMVWCGEGDCVADGTRHHCRCHDDADNIQNNPTNICIKRCSIRADCKNLGIVLPSPSSPPPPPPHSSANSLGCGTTIVGYMVAQVIPIVVVFTSMFMLMTEQVGC